MTLGEQIKRLRVSKRLTQSELGALINSTKSSISNYERNFTKPPYAVLNAIANALDVPASELLACMDGGSDGSEADIEKQVEKNSLRRLRHLQAVFQGLTDEAQIKVIRYAEDLMQAPVFVRSILGSLQGYVSGRCRCEFDVAADMEETKTYSKGDDSAGGTWEWRARHMAFCHGTGTDNAQRWDFFYLTFDMAIHDHDAIRHILSSAESLDSAEGNIVFVFDDKEAYGRFYDCYSTDRAKKSKCGAELEDQKNEAPALFLLVEKGTWDVLDEYEYRDPYR